MLNYQEIDFCEFKVNYVAEPEVVIQKKIEATDEIFKESRKIAVQGFRKGKAPLEVVKVRLKKQIEAKLQEKLIAQAYDDYLLETNAKPIYYPQIHNVQLTSGSFECQLNVKQVPKFDIKEYVGLNIPKPALGSTVEQLTEKMLEDLRQENGSAQAYSENDYVEMNDKITLDIECKVDDKIVPEFTMEGLLLEVGQGLLKDIDFNLLGMKAGETREFETPYNTETGQQAQFKVLVHMGLKKIPAALDLELAVKAGFQTLEELRAHANMVASNFLSNQENQVINNQIKLSLLADNDFRIPDFMLQMESEAIAVQAGKKFKDCSDDEKQMILDEAGKRVRLTYILAEIKDKEPDANASESDILEILRNRITANGQDPDQTIKQLMDNKQIFGVIAGIQEEMIMQWLRSKQNIVE